MTTADSHNEHHFCFVLLRDPSSFKFRCNDLIFLILTAGDSAHRCISS